MSPTANVFMIVLCALCGCALAADAPRPILLPTPKKVEWLDGSIKLSTRDKPLACIKGDTGDKAIATGIAQLNERLKKLGMAELPVLSGESKAPAYSTVIFVASGANPTQGYLGLKPYSVPPEAAGPDGYILKCDDTPGLEAIIACVGHDQRGCYYGIQTLIQLMSVDGGTVSIPRVSITDWPTFRIRLVKTNADSDKPDNVARWADLLPQFKLNTLAGQFHTGHGSLAWNKPGPIYLANTESIARASRTTDTYDAMLYLSPFGKNRGSLLDPETINEYVRILESRIAQGYRSVVVDLNDWGTYKHLTPEEQTHFKDIGEVMTWITNRVYEGIHSAHPEVGILAVPAAGYYGGLPKPELISFCRSIPKDILVMTTGPVTRSRTITAEFLKDWAEATGRKPFLWDNTLYSHLDQYKPVVSGLYNFNAFEVTFPPDMPGLLAGPGIHLNGGAIRWWEPGVLTFLDYMWNPEAYNPKASLRNAQILLWGKDAPDAANEAQQRAIELYDYLFNAYSKKTQGTREEATAKLAQLETAVKRLAGIVGDPVVSDELDEKCIGAAKGAIDKVFQAAGSGKAQ